MKWKAPGSKKKKGSDKAAAAKATTDVVEEKSKDDKKKRSEKKTRSEQISPLMGDTADSSKASATSSASSTRQTDGQRDKRKKERAEKKKKRAKNYEEKQEAAAQVANKGKVKKLSQAEQDAKDSKLTCCHKFAEPLAKLVHLIDFIIGLAFLGYGSFLFFEADAVTNVAIGCVSFGGFHVVTCIAGFIGFKQPCCWRMGLAISLYSGAILTLGYAFILVYSFGNHEPLFDFLTEHMHSMALNEETIKVLKELLPFWYITLGGLIAMELVRFVMLFRLRENLIRFDAVSKRQGSEGSQRSLMTTPLLDEETGQA